MSSIEEKYQAAAEVLEKAGFGQFGKNPPAVMVMTACDMLGQFLAGADVLIKEVCIAAAVVAIRLSDFCDAEQAKRIVRAAIRQGFKADDDTYRTFGETPSGEIIVDIVQDERELKWVVARPPGKRTHPLQKAVEVVGQVADRVMWPRPTLPWKDSIPHASAVRRAWDVGTDGRELFLDLTQLFVAPPPKQLVTLPEPRGVWAALIALWIMGTYVIHSFKYFPILLLEGPPERGKSRCGNAAIFLGWRGYATQSPTEAVIFRWAQRHGVGLFLDVYDLPGKMAKRDDLADLLLSRWERGKEVPRVLNKEARTPPEEIKSFASFGPTILGSNVDVRSDHPLASRCIRIPMPEAGSSPHLDTTTPSDAYVLAMRARLVAWAAEVIASGEALPPAPPVTLTGRMGNDAMPPILRMARLVYPACIPALVALVRGVDKSRRDETADSSEARVVASLAALHHEGHWVTMIGYKQILDHVNDGLAEADQFTLRRLGWMLKHLNLASSRHGKGENRHRYVEYPGDDVLTDLCARYDAPVLQQGSDTSATTGTTGPTGSEAAN